MTTGPALHNSRTFRSSTFSIVLQLMQYEILTERPVFDLSKKHWGVLGASRIFCVGAQMEAPTGERRRREDRGAEGAEGGRVWGGGPPSPAD